MKSGIYTYIHNLNFDIVPQIVYYFYYSQLC